MGIEPTLAAWEAAVLPLNYARGGGQSRVPPPDLATPRGVDPRGAPDPQKPAPTLANTIACLPPFWPLLTLAPMSASRPNSRVRAPKVSVVQDWS